MNSISIVNVKKRMAELKLSTRKELADTCKFSLSTATRILNGTAKPEATTVGQLSSGLKTTQAYILGEVEETPPIPMNLSDLPWIEIKGKIWATPFRLSMGSGTGKFIRGLPGEQNCYALEVEGDSMLPIYPPRDLVVCRPHQVELRPYSDNDDASAFVPVEHMTPYHHRDVIVDHNGETTLKRLRIERRSGPKYDIWMDSMNAKYAPVKLRFGDDWNIRALVIRTQKPEVEPFE